jgi:hypothetical protein
MAVFMHGQHIVPGQAAQLKAVLGWGKVKLAPERAQRHITVRHGGIGLQDDAYFLLAAANGRQGAAAQPLRNGGNAGRRTVKPLREDNPRFGIVYLLPAHRWPVTAKLLRQQGTGTKKQDGNTTLFHQLIIFFKNYHTRFHKENEYFFKILFIFAYRASW